MDVKIEDRRKWYHKFAAVISGNPPIVEIDFGQGTQPKTGRVFLNYLDERAVKAGTAAYFRFTDAHAAQHMGEIKPGDRVIITKLA